MILKRITGATRVLHAPNGHDNETNPLVIAGLPIRDELIEGMQFMVSAWEPSPEELARLNRGAMVHLYISAPAHPVTAIIVSEIADG